MTTTQASRPYHHGDLRRALLQAAQDLIDARGVHGFTLREVARQAGVSHNAPYNHFADKADLIAALVAEGFDQFAHDLREAYETTAGSPLDKVLATGVAYVLFAFAHPSLFRLMFRPELRQSEHAGSEMPGPQSYAEDSGFQVLLVGLQRCQAEGLVQQGDVMLLALASWSIVHGLAVLMLDGAAGELARTRDDAAELTRRMNMVLRLGLQAR